MRGAWRGARQGCCGQGVVWERAGCADGRRVCLCTYTLSPLLFSCKVDRTLRGALSAPGLAAMSAVVIHCDTVLWTGNFGKKNGSDPASGPPDESTMYRSAGRPPGSWGGDEGWEDEGPRR